MDAIDAAIEAGNVLRYDAYSKWAKATAKQRRPKSPLARKKKCKKKQAPDDSALVAQIRQVPFPAVTSIGASTMTALYLRVLAKVVLYSHSNSGPDMQESQCGADGHLGGVAGGQVRRPEEEKQSKQRGGRALRGAVCGSSQPRRQPWEGQEGRQEGKLKRMANGR